MSIFCLVLGIGYFLFGNPILHTKIQLGVIASTSHIAPLTHPSEICKFHLSTTQQPSFKLILSGIRVVFLISVACQLLLGVVHLCLCP